MILTGFCLVNRGAGPLRIFWRIGDDRIHTPPAYKPAEKHSITHAEKIDQDQEEEQQFSAAVPEHGAAAKDQYQQDEEKQNTIVFLTAKEPSHISSPFPMFTGLFG
jgi:hypothetical protein